MRMAVLVLLVCVACVGHGQRLQGVRDRLQGAPHERQQHSEKSSVSMHSLASQAEGRQLQSERLAGVFNPLHALAAILRSFNLASAFSPSSCGIHFHADARHCWGRCRPITSMSDESAELSDAEKLTLKAEKLKLQAEKAALEVEILELEAEGIKPISPSGKADDTVALEEDVPEPMKIASNLKFVGPYPCLSLRFPKLGTSAQRQRDEAGVTFDFVLDTAANTNTINAELAKELALEVVGRAAGGSAAGGDISGGDTYMLGECQLWERLEMEEGASNPSFMSDLTASALPVASPAAGGILGVYFFNAFPGGVEFFWKSQAASIGSATVSFYGDKTGMEKLIARKNLTDKVEIRVLPSGLPSVKLVVNGAEIPALLDTGSPITVLNAKAAKMAKLETVDLEVNKDSDSGGFNPFAKIAKGFKTTQARANALSSGDLLILAGTGGEPVELIRSTEEAQVSVGDAAFSDTKLFVGDLPGLAALQGLLGDDGPPAAVLGMDVLRLRPRMLYRANEVYF